MLHDEVCFLTEAAQAHSDIPLVVHLSRIPWAGEPGDWQAAQRAAEALGATVVVGDWGSEEEHRAAAMEDLRSRGFTHALIADTDEFIEPRLLQHLVTIAENDLADRVYVEWDTYWKSIHHVVRPRERFKPCILIKLDTAVGTRNRDFIGGRALYLDESYGIVHHLSYVGDDERIWRKITTWGHRTEVVPGWWERVWKGWDADPTLRSLHTTHPDAYDFTERITPPQFLLDLGLDKTGPAPRPLLTEPSIHPWPAISVVIPAHNGPDDLDRCLASLAVLDDLLHEVIVVDNGSLPPASAPPGVTLLRNETNLGFALASNQGAERGTGDVVLFLNSDTAVPRAGLIRLVESLMASGAIAASGPLTNNSGHFQRINPTFTSLENLDLYASEFAHRTAEDMETDMLVGFCLAVKRRALDEVGLFDPRFGLGTFEDNDLCYRLRRAGYRLVISSRSYVHHEGSKTMSRLAGAEAPLDIQGLLREYHGKYLARWSADLESGFASHLSGLSAQPITFHQARRPEARLARIQADVQRADISLCMIVKDEERVIKDCLESAKPFFKEILILDTGSTDQTVEIAKECGALVTQGSWPDSFALARTQSMAGAKGEWIMWLDADDTLPLGSGEAIVRAVASAPRDVVGFVLPVRFVEEQGNGTQVDHVKVFRNYPGLEWEGRIHEQVLPSLRKAAKAKGLPDGGKLARLDAYVLHSGYDNSEIGQARKRVRDEKLLKLDLAERPDHPFVLFNLGMTSHYTGSQEEAADWLRKSISQSEPGESHLRKAYSLLGASLKQAGRKEEARQALEEGLAKAPGDPEILFHLAQLSADRGDHALAVSQYKEVLSADISGVFTSLDPGILSWKARHNMALSFLALGDYPGAREQWQTALRETGRPELAIALLGSALEHSDTETAKGLVAWAAERFGPADVWAQMVESLCSSVGLDPAPQLGVVLSRDPENLPVRKALARVLLNSGRSQDAVGHLDLLQSRGEAEGAFFLGVLSEEAGDSRKASAWYERALELNPSHSETSRRLQNLG